MAEYNEGETATGGVNDSSGVGAVDSVADFKADLMLLAEVTERVGAQDADMWSRLDDEQRPDYYALVTTARRKLTDADVGFVHAHDQFMPMGRSKRPQWLVREFYMTAQEARGVLAAAERIDGRALGPEQRVSKKYMPKVHELVKEGLLDGEGLRRIDKAIKDMPERAHGLLVERGDAIIADLARQCGPEILNDLKDLLWALLDEEEPEYEPKDHARKREVRLSRPGRDGMSRLTGVLTPRLAAVFQRLLADYGNVGGLLEDGELDEVGLKEDPRTPGQRAHDCLEAALFKGFSREDRDELREEFSDLFGDGWNRESEASDPAEREPSDRERDSADAGVGSSAGAGSSGEVGAGEVNTGEMVAGEEDIGADRLRFDELDPEIDRPDTEYIPDLRERCLKPRRGSTSIVAVVTLEDLLRRTGFGMTDAGVKMGMDDLIRGALAQDFYLHVLDFQGRSLWLGRSQRRGSLDQYLALCAEEGGSTAPGSDAPPARCHVHHIQGWEHGGETNIDNLTLADPYMHAQVDDTRTNANKWWTVGASERSDSPDGEKLQWIPPASEDPQRKPQQNLHSKLFRTPGRRRKSSPERQERQ